MAALALAEDVTTEVGVTLATKLRQAREEAGLTRAKVADMTNGVLTAKAIEKYEAGVEPPVTKLKLLADIYGLTPEEIFGEIDSPAPKGRVARKPSPAPSADMNSDLVRSLSMVLAKHGVKVRFSPTGSVDVEEGEGAAPAPETDPTIPGEVELEAVGDLVESKGVVAKALPAKITAAQAALSALDADELAALAERFGYSLDLLADVGDEDAMADLSAADHDSLTDQAAALLLVQAIYPDFIYLTAEGLEAAREDINSALATGDFLAAEPVSGLGLLDGMFGGDDAQATYEGRLWRELPPRMLECIEKRKPLDLSDKYRFPVESKPARSAKGAAAKGKAKVKSGGRKPSGWGSGW